ncbi:FAD-binding protein [Babesia caballi]|uniref:FAD-binding protein n=1 Tax=Babesia caballi TaxID=5871 RepID=A0AAV4M1M5_BABCB|nr:FAD-binding protein [Babesia caballi]
MRSGAGGRLRGVADVVDAGAPGKGNGRLQVLLNLQHLLEERTIARNKDLDALHAVGRLLVDRRGVAVVALHLHAVLDLGLAGRLDEAGVEVARHHPVGAHVDGLDDVAAGPAAAVGDDDLARSTRALLNGKQLALAGAEAGARRRAAHEPRANTHLGGVGAPALQVAHRLGRGDVARNDEGLPAEGPAHVGDHVADAVAVAVGDVDGDVLRDEVLRPQVVDDLVRLRQQPDGYRHEELQLPHSPRELHNVDFEAVHHVEVVPLGQLDGNALVEHRGHVRGHQRQPKGPPAQLRRDVRHGAALQGALPGDQRDVVEVEALHDSRTRLKHCMWAVSAGRRLHCVAGRRPCGALFPGAIGGVATLVHRSSLHSVGEYHSRIVERADSCSKRVSYADASRLLSQFVAEGYDAGRLRGFFDYDGDTRLCIDDYFVILQLCKQLELQDLDLLSSLSEDLRLAFVELYATQQPKDAVRSPDSDGNPSAEPERLTQRGSRSRRAFRVDRSSMPPLKDAVMSESHQHQADISHVATCVLFNELHILHDPLFATIGDLLLKHGEDLSLPELDLLLRTYASQHYRDHEFVAALVSRVEDEAGALDPETAVRLYRSLSFLDIMSPSLCAALESRFCERVDTGSGARFGFAAALRLPDLIDVGYAKFVQGSADNESFWFIRGVLEGFV